MYVHRMTFAAPDMDTTISIKYRSEYSIMSSSEYENLVMTVWDRLKLSNENVKEPILVGYIKTRE